MSKEDEMSDGYAMATFRWCNRCGYEYEVVETDPGCFELRYREDAKNEPVSSLTFNHMDAPGIMKMMQAAVDFYNFYNASDKGK